MTGTDRDLEPAAALRRRAEAIVSEAADRTPEARTPEARTPEARTPEEARRSLHELRVHQIELEMQNEELRRRQVELEAVRSRYFDLYDLAPVGYCTLSEQGLILEANLTAATLLGLSRGALVRQPISRFLLPEDQDSYYLHRQQLAATGEQQTFELRMLGHGPATAAPFWAQLTTSIEQGSPPVHRLVLSDITRRKQAEAELVRLNESLETRIQARTIELQAALETVGREVQERRKATAALALEEEKFRLVADYTFDWEDWLSPDGTFAYVSPSCERITGYPPQAFLADPGLFLRIVHPEDVRIVEPHYSSVCEHPEAQGLEFRILTRSGEVRWISHLCQPVYGGDGTWLGQRGSNRDISARMRAQEAARQSEAKYVNVVEHSPTGIFILCDQEIPFANPRFFEILRRAPEELATLRPWEFLHPEDRPAIREIWRQCLAERSASRDYECRILTPGGGVRWINGRCTVIPFGDGPALLVNIQDITEYRAALQALRDSQEALHALSARMLASQEDERLRVARELHDSIGSALSAIKFMVEGSLETAFPAGRDDHLTALRAVIPIIQNSVEEVRRISMALRPMTLDDLGLIVTIDWFLREFRKAHAGVQVQQRIELTETELPDALKIELFRILQEGVNNAAKHSRATHLDVRLWRDEEQLVLELEDDGVGFDPTGQGPPGARGGFGLASMGERARLSGGELTILAAPGKGTRLRARWSGTWPTPAQG